MAKMSSKWNWDVIEIVLKMVLCSILNLLWSHLSFNLNELLAQKTPKNVSVLCIFLAKFIPLKSDQQLWNTPI